MKKNSGFSLVELSIVMVIIGLIVGGLMAGQNLIRAAELRSVADDLSKYQNDVEIFQDTYSYLPGDMPNATDIWGATDAGDGLGADCYDVASSGGTTCNGNANGRLNLTDGSASNPEGFNAWVQLANAGLVKGKFTGTKVAATTRQANPETNIPKSKISGGGYSLISNDVASADPTYFSGDYALALFFGLPTTNIEVNSAILSPIEAHQIDVKLDDGLPGKGQIRTRRDTGCTTTTVHSTAKYALTLDDTVCNLIYSFTDPSTYD